MCSISLNMVLLFTSVYPVFDPVSLFLGGLKRSCSVGGVTGAHWSHPAADLGTSILVSSICVCGALKPSQAFT